MKYIVFCFLFTALLVWRANGQTQQEITGTVYANDGAPLSGVSVRLVGNTIATQTDQNGKYNIYSKDGGKLTFNYIGYIQQTVDIKGRSSIDVTLVRDESAIEEVVVSAGGILRSTREQGYATTQIGAENLTRGKSPTIAGGLQGKVPGLQINQTTSGVNPNYRLVLRGNRSVLGDNTALIVLDNAVVSSDLLNNINPADIENVQILNGAAGAAAYGAEGSNGVLLITSKKGAPGRTVINASNTFTLEDISFFPKLQDRFGAGSTADAQIYSPEENQQFGPAFDGSTVAIGLPLENGDQQYGTYSALNDRYDFWNVGRNNQTDISLSTANENSSQYVAGQYLTGTGTTPGDKYNRVSFRLNGSRKFYPNLTLDYATSYVENQYDITSATSSIYTQLTQTPANIPLLSYKDWVNNPFATPDGWYNPWYLNPYWTADNYRSDTKNSYLTAKIELKYTPFEWLQLTYRPSISNRWYDNKSKSPKQTYSDYSLETIGRTNLVGGVSDEEYSKSRVNHDLQIGLKKDLNDFSFNLTLTGTAISNRYKNVYVSATGLEIPGLYNVSNRIGEAGASEINTLTRTYAFWGDLLAGYKNYLFLHLTGRNDWTSVLRKENRSYFYPSADLSFIVTDAFEGLKDNSVLNFLKIRGGVSRIGYVNLDPYSLEATFSSVTGYGNGTYFSQGSQLVSTDIKPEITTGSEFGADFRLWDNRIDGTVTSYYTRTKGQAIPAGIAVSSGYSTYLVNTGLVTNKGIETALHVTPIRTNDWELTLGGNYTHNRNLLKELYPGLDRVSINGSSVIYAQVGKELNQIIVTDYARDDQGRVIVDVNTGYPSVASESKIIGNTTPRHRLGLDLNLRWKDFTFSTLFEYRGGFKYAAISLGSNLDFSGASARSAYYNRERFVFPNSSYYDENTGEYVANKDITVSDGGSGFWTSSTYNRGVYSNYVVSGNYWKWREASLSYRLPTHVLERLRGVKGASVSVQGRNLLLLVPKSNEYTDPDYSANDNNAIGVSTTAQTPPTRYFGATVSLTF
ncbi:SusC/RagA family TonB-linked outer membrane protein [Sphingobacterium sp. LRF_L2]|uniref:SusC/RagA family TonB-linked outer membrane protein n=1 Tax=Sphingobacterium sp. LRF_L2 TaxID=3369421 RepID=UPI003F641342